MKLEFTTMDYYPSISGDTTVKCVTRKKSVNCFVPNCPSNSIKFPNKLFLTLPTNPKLREMWMKAAQRENSLSPKSVMRCCEDHFDMENDIENWMRYKLIGGKLMLKKGVIPHIFDCQQRIQGSKPTSVKQKHKKQDTKEWNAPLGKLNHNLMEEILQSIENGEARVVESSFIPATDEQEIFMDVEISKHECMKIAVYPQEISKEPLVDIKTPTTTTAVSSKKVEMKNKRFTKTQEIELEENIKSENISDIENRDTQSAKKTQVFYPKYNIEVEYTAEEVLEDQTKAVIAKVYHYLEQEYKELKEIYGYLDLTPLSKVRERTAKATGVSESRVLQILQEEEERNAPKQAEPPKKRRRVRKRSRKTDSSNEEEDSLDDNEPRNIQDAQIDFPSETLAVKVEMESTDIENSYQETKSSIDLQVDVKTEPQDDEVYNEQATTAIDPIGVDAEPYDDEWNKQHSQGESSSNIMTDERGLLIMKEEFKLDFEIHEEGFS